VKPSIRAALCAGLLLLARASADDADPDTRHRLLLNSGNELTGRLLKRTPEAYWVDVGHDVLRIPAEHVTEAAEVRPDEQTGAPPPSPERFEDRLWAERATSRARPVEAWVPRLSAGVVEIRSRAGQGSGFIINPRGMILTNHHVIAGDRELTVTVFEESQGHLERIQYRDIRIIALDPANDLALLRIEDELEAPLKWLPFGRSNDMQTGEPVFAIGSPLGLDRTVSRGIVSLADRLVGGRLYLQTTAQINPGNSGGPLFNLRGEVIGVNTLKFVHTGIEGVGFAIPSESVKLFLAKRDAYAFDPRNANTGYRYLNPPRKSERNPEPAKESDR